MLEKTHRRIAQEIAKELNLGEREAGLLEAGSVNPDSWADFPHHYGKELEIMRNILDARRLFLQGDDECYFKLGIALHYIEDRWTLRPRMKDKHTRWEMTIETCPILNDSELMKLIKQAPLPTKAEQAYLDFLEKVNKGAECMTTAECLTTIRTGAGFSSDYIRGSGSKVITYALQERPTTWSNPIFDLNFSYRICLEVARNVFSREHDKEDWYDTNAERRDMEIAARKREIAAEEAVIAATERREKEGMQALVLGLIMIVFSIAGFASGHAFLAIMGIFFFIFGIVLSLIGITKLL